MNVKRKIAMGAAARRETVHAGHRMRLRPSHRHFERPGGRVLPSIGHLDIARLSALRDGDRWRSWLDDAWASSPPAEARSSELTRP